MIRSVKDCCDLKTDHKRSAYHAVGTHYIYFFKVNSGFGTFNIHENEGQPKGRNTQI